MFSLCILWALPPQHVFFKMCSTSSCYEQGSLAVAQRQDPIIRTQFTWLAGNLPLGGEV